MRRALNYVFMVVSFPLVAVWAFALLVADPFRFTRMLSEAGKRLRPFFEPTACSKCGVLLNAAANDQHAGMCCNCVEVLLLTGKRRGRHREFCKGRTAE
jgi:hypothetical protein